MTCSRPTPGCRQPEETSAGRGASVSPRLTAARYLPVVPTVTGSSRPSAHRRWLAIAIPLAIVAAVVVWRAIPPEVDGMPVVRRDVARTLVLTGRVRPAARSLVGATVAGAVREVLVREGDRVRAGQPLVRLDATQTAAAVAEARAALAETRVGARAELERAERERDQAERDLARARQLHQADAISARELERATQTAADARAAWDAASARAAAGDSLANVARAQAALEAAQARLALTRLTAPAAATVVARRVEPGDVVTPGQVLLELTLDGRTEIVAFASEETLGHLRQGMPAVVSADAYADQSFPALVSWIAPAVDPAQGTIEVRLALPEPPAYLLPEMTVSVNIDVARRAGALVVPRDAVELVGRDSGWVLLQVDGRAVRREVWLGIMADDGVEILDGLVEGDVVLPLTVAPGARVRVAR